MKVLPEAGAAIERILLNAAPLRDKVTERHAMFGVRSGAIFSHDERYRFLLWRVWDANRPLWTFGMLNPSTADADVLDPTITRCLYRAMDGGAGGLIVWNLFAWRATDPRDMKAAEDPVGPNNDLYMLLGVRDAARNIVGWGNHGSHLNRDRYVRDLLAMTAVEVHALNITSQGQPQHPLYVSAATEPQPWSIAA